MGTRFRYIADDALRTVEGAICIVCDRDDVDVYPYSGYWIQPSGDSESVGQVCAECIKTADLRWLGEDDLGDSLGSEFRLVETEHPEITWQPGQDHVIRYGLRVHRYRKVPVWTGKSAELLDKLRRTPQIPWMTQGSDWVVCCSDLCEFIGSPRSKRELLKVRRKAHFWHHGPARHPRNFRREGPPEFYEEISVFRCLACGKRYWIDHYT